MSQTYFIPPSKMISGKHKIKDSHKHELPSKKILIQPDGVTLFPGASKLKALLSEALVLPENPSSISPTTSATTVVATPCGNGQQGENQTSKIQSDTASQSTATSCPKLPPSSQTAVQGSTTTPVTPPVGIIIYQYNIQDGNNILKNGVLQNGSIQFGNYPRPSKKPLQMTNKAKIKNMTQLKLSGRINLLKADLKAEKQKCLLLQRKMVELRNNLNNLREATKEALESPCKMETSKPLKVQDLNIKQC